MAQFDLNHIHTQMLDAIGEAVIATDLQGNIQYWNRAAEKLYQWHTKEVIGKNIVNVTPSNTTRKQAEEIMQALSQGASWTGRFEVTRKDGTSFLALVNDSPIYDEKGELIGIIGISRDLTPQLKKEEALQRRENQLNEAQRVAAIGSWNYNIQTQQPTWTNQMFRLFGIEPEDGVPTYDEHRNFIHPDDWEDFDKSVKKTAVTGIGYDIEIRFVQPSGKTIWINTCCETRKENDEVVELFGTTQDITAQKEAEAEIRKLKSFYEDVNENVQDGIWVTDKDDVIFYVNRGMERIAGVLKEMIIGNNVLKDFPKQTTEKFNVFYRKAKKELKPTWYEVTVETPAGVDTWQNGWLVPVLANGNFDGIICTIRDVTERKKAELALKESDGTI